MFVMSYRVLILCIAIVTAAVCLPMIGYAAHISDLPPALRLDPAQQVTTVEAKINATRSLLGNPHRTIDARLQSAAAECFTRADTCRDANAYMGLLASHGYSMGAVHIALGFGRSEDEVLAQWLADPYTAYTIYKTGGYSVYEDMGCAVQGIGYGVNVVCFVATEYAPMEVTPTALPMPQMPTPRPLATSTSTPSPSGCPGALCVTIASDAPLRTLMQAGQLCGLAGVTCRKAGE